MISVKVKEHSTKETEMNTRESTAMIKNMDMVYSWKMEINI